MNISKITEKEEQRRRTQKKTHPMTHTTAPTTDNNNATSAKGSPSKKPNGLQSPIFSLSLSLSLPVKFLCCEFAGDLLLTNKMCVQRKYTAMCRLRRGK